MVRLERAGQGLALVSPEEGVADQPAVLRPGDRGVRLLGEIVPDWISRKNIGSKLLRRFSSHG